MTAARSTTVAARELLELVAMDMAAGGLLRMQTTSCRPHANAKLVLKN
jgi:hypothetical protein